MPLWNVSTANQTLIKITVIGDAKDIGAHEKGKLLGISPGAIVLHSVYVVSTSIVFSLCNCCLLV